ncbi:MAG TPA: ABC transporter permease [Kofleriaceae bacterium]|jgi:simple sugar transport system permease protein
MKKELQAAAIALLASMAIGSVLVLVVGQSPAHVWWQMVVRTFSSWYDVGQLLYKATALVFTGLGVALALDAGLFNIGGEAQLGAGVLACAMVGTALPAGTPALVAIPACTLAAAVAGGAIGWLIGVLRVTRGAHEVITSIMLDAIVAGIVLWIANAYVFVNGTATGLPIARGAELPSLGMGGSAANVALVLALAVAGAMWWLRARTTWGQAWRTVGADREAARSAGIAVGRVQILVMTGSGALCGLAATSLVLGHEHAYEQGLGAGVGFLGISAALLGRMHPVGIVLAALVLGFLSSGGLAVDDLVPKELTEVLQGVVILAIAAAVPLVRRASP